MLINRKELEQIAVLAKLQVSEQEMDTITSSLDSVVNMINHINEADTQGVKPMANPMDAVQRLRADEVTQKSLKSVLLAQAKVADEDYFLVPTVVE
jgi:aspartyl-tRNA(Asn)/glutamyl-tRNA(Gln) amidotransferase subunit C